MTPRRPPLREVGHDPDYRFTLANERTFLAWLRTGLGLVAGAVALQSLAPDLGPGPLRTGLIAVLLVLATVVTLGAYRRWDRAERALRQDRSLPTGSLPRIVAGGVSVVILGAFLLVLLSGISR